MSFQEILPENSVASDWQRAAEKNIRQQLQSESSSYAVLSKSPMKNKMRPLLKRKKKVCRKWRCLHYVWWAQVTFSRTQEKENHRAAADGWISDNAAQEQSENSCSLMEGCYHWRYTRVRQHAENSNAVFAAVLCTFLWLLLTIKIILIIHLCIKQLRFQVK